MATTTTNLGLTLPTPNVDTGWGSTLNTDFTLIDNIFASDGTGTSVGIFVGTGKTASISGTLIAGGTVILGSGDGTGTVTAPTIRGAAATGSNITGANLTFDAANGTGTGGSGKIIFRTASAGSSGSTANTFADRLVIDSSGNAGFGTNSPLYNIDVQSSSDPIIRAKTTGTGSAWFVGEAGASGTVLWHNPTNTPSVFTTNGVERFRIGTSGQLGVAGANYGTSGQALVSRGSSSSPEWGSVINIATAVNTTSGVSHDFTGIPSGVKRITVILSNVSTNGTSQLLIQLGTSSGIDATGYASSAWGAVATASNMAVSTVTSGFILTYTSESTASFHGSVNLLKVDSNTWVQSGVVNSSQRSGVSSGTKSLSGVIDRVRITTLGGTNAFDSGTVNIMWEF
jgi:hypothetical protein